MRTHCRLQNDANANIFLSPTPKNSGQMTMAGVAPNTENKIGTMQERNANSSVRGACTRFKLYILSTIQAIAHKFATLATITIMFPN